MTAPRVSTDWSFRGLQAITLENDLVRIVVLPELGGKIWELCDQLTGRQFLWHNPRIAPAKLPFGAGYDDMFFGGWDELFPNDIPEEILGEPLPDHGEAWTLPWTWDVVRDADVVSVHLQMVTPITNCLLRKVLTLRAGERQLRVSAAIANHSDFDLPFLWKQHVALEVDQPARIDLPAVDVLLGNFGNPRAGQAGQSYPWPYLTDDRAQTHDMRVTLTRDSGRSEFQYATGLTAGWCSLTHQDGNGLLLTFDPTVFRSCWTFASYGGWRGLQVAVLEPCTGYPISVVEGEAAGTHQTLGAGQTLSSEMVAIVYDGLRAVTGVTEDLLVTGDAL